MLRRLRNLAGRYEERHLSPGMPGPALRGADGARLGQVERIRIVDSRLFVSGWAQAETVAVTSGGRHAEVRPSLRRDDVAGLLGGKLEAGFEIDLPYEGGGAAISLVDRAGDTLSRDLPMPSAARMLRLRLRLRAGLVRRLASMLPDIWRVWHRGDPPSRERVKTALGLDTVAPAPPLSAGLMSGALPAPVPEGAVTVVMPVYGAHEMTLDCLSRMAAGAGMPWRAIIIDDASPDEATRPALRRWMGAMHDAGHDVTLIENETNLGFIGSVNRAFEAALAHDEPVVLLNSDAFLPEGWAPRLLRPLSDPDVASATPMSNDATILSVPCATSPASLATGDADAIDAQARTISARPVPLPTGVGFCMVIAPAWLRR
ncbi:MAG: glycosyltransferase, partial [Pseudomonadota bacterium]